MTAEYAGRQAKLNAARDNMVKTENIKIKGKTYAAGFVGGLRYADLRDSDQKPQAQFIMKWAQTVGRNKVVFFASKLDESTGKRVLASKVWNYAEGADAPNRSISVI